MATLQARLDRIRAGFSKEAPDNVKMIMHQTTSDLIASGLADRALGEGDRAPDFVLPDQSGDEVSLAEMRSLGPVVLTVFRGHW